MDPDAALAAIREAIMRIETSGRQYENHPDVDSLIEHFQALDEWLSKGGFSPNSWENATDWQDVH